MRPRPALVITHDQVLRLSWLAALLADPERRDSVAAALDKFPLLEGIADAVHRWPPDVGSDVVTGRMAVRWRPSEVNDLLRLALTVLPGAGVLKEVQELGALRVYAPVPWLDGEPSGTRLVLVDTPGPDEDLRPGVLNSLVADEVRDAHELLVVADAARRESEAEAAVQKVIRDALPWPGRTELLVAVSRADMRPELEDLLGPGKADVDDALAPELRAAWDRLAGVTSGVIPRVVVTAARDALAAATVVRPAKSQAEADREAQAFLRLIRPVDWKVAPASRQWLREQAEETWQWSGVDGLLKSFLEPRAREPERYRLRALLHQVASALPPSWDGFARDRPQDVARTVGLDWPGRTLVLLTECAVPEFQVGNLTCSSMLGARAYPPLLIFTTYRSRPTLIIPAESCCAHA